MPRKFLAIVNPHGGKRIGARALASAEQLLAAADVEVEAHFTESAEHARHLASCLPLSEFECLLVVGGDGTVHDVVAGLMARADGPGIPLGLIPAGTGNTVATQLGCVDVSSAVAQILSRHERFLDVVAVTSGEATYHCVNIVGWGGVVDINQKAEQLRRVGPSRYALASLWQLWRPQHRHAKVTLDGKTVEGDFLFVIGCVTKSTGKGMVMAPHAELDDGRVDVVIARRANRRALLTLFGRVFRGTHLDLPFLDYHQVRAFKIDAAPSPLNLDGENKGHAPFEAHVVPRALRVRAQHR